jgi:signal transduction histidine kinase
VAIASQAGQVIVEITNSGAAIPDEIMPRLFEPFLQPNREAKVADWA